MVMAAVTSMDTVMRAMHISVHPIPANCPGTSGTVLDLLLLSPVPHTRCYGTCVCRNLSIAVLLFRYKRSSEDTNTAPEDTSTALEDTNAAPEDP